ncbi:sensor histidine kinase [Alkaliphilus transvaalensis]|uniref:sensor histidine kinase n=1 Tax=Alkaliphilus transvaalensis TaxID=114628 RepID=UPI00047B5370|nr:ATP-binding protein [Alkaliphilus transvaalensis]
MFKSIRWKFITIYFLLVFIAMIIIGVFLIQQFQQYHFGEVSKNIEETANYVMMALKDLDLEKDRNDIQANISPYEMMGLEIYVIKNDSSYTIAATTNTGYISYNATDILEPDLILAAFFGEKSEKGTLRNNRSTMNNVYPIYDEHSRIIGALYLRKDLTDINETLEQSKRILINATFLALLITIVLGFFIAKSITGPIQDVTTKAEKMSKGDFDQYVEVKSDDEIGQLASMFNLLTGKLKATLQEMSSEKQKMDTIITYMADGLIAANGEGRVIHANPRAIEMLGLNEEKLLNMGFDEIFNPFNERLTISQLKSIVNGESKSEMMVMQDGITLRANYASFINEKSEFGGIIVLLQDVTEHEKLEKIRKEFVANVSHELKTPLTTIKSYTETLIDGVIDEKEMALQFLHVIDTEVDRMNRLVRDLLQLSNIDFKKGAWDKKAVDLNDVIKKVVLKLDVSAKNKEQQLKCFVEDEVNSIDIFADEDRIEQVLLNVVSNSLKYTPKGGLVEVTVKSTEENAVIEIIDTGIGIPKEDIPRLFERFYRVDKARSREMGGTGLGLSIAKEIIDAHEGSIQIFSNEEKGTKVVISLPLMGESHVIYS